MPVITDAGAKKAARGKKAKALKELHERIQKAEWDVESDVQFIVDNMGWNQLLAAVSKTGVHVWVGDDIVAPDGAKPITPPNPDVNGKVLIKGKPLFLLGVEISQHDDDGNLLHYPCRVAVPDLDRSPGELARAVWPFWVKSEESSLREKFAALLKSGVTVERLHELVDLAAVKEVLKS